MQSQSNNTDSTTTGSTTENTQTTGGSTGNGRRCGKRGDNNGNGCGRGPGGPGGRPGRRPRRLLFGLLAFGAIAATVAALCGGHHHRHGMAGQIDGERIESMVSHVLDDATPAQKASVTRTLQNTATQLQPLRAQVVQARDQAVILWRQPVVDPAAMELLRERQVRLADQASQIIKAGMIETASVLTPAQRGELADKLQRHWN